ncbi:ABC-type transport auxiliary lipoprotein family protein [Caulobacter sp. KR2-114]|uniref:ABC-type transport auxiliary lipoprotein family protein n=1 Tax=Caulobacter sp. KR2-114 TaxID=3400912 RepID=UPI003C0F9E67
MKSLGRAASLAAAALALSACVSVFPKQAPATMFRFGVTTPPPAPAGGGQPFGVIRAVTSFDRAAASERILTVDGPEAAYIKGSRWVSGASVLFDEAVTRAFDGSGGPARLIGRGEVVRADYVLKLDVRSFEARYDHGAKAAPTVVVVLHADLDRVNDRAAVGSRTFTAEVPAGDNRVSAIAAAFDQAVTKVLGDLVLWVDARGQG